MVLSNIKKEYLINQLYFSFNSYSILNLYYFNNINLKERLKLKNTYFFNSRLFTPIVNKNNNLFMNYNIGSFFFIPLDNRVQELSNDFNFTLFTLNNYICSKSSLKTVLCSYDKIKSEIYINQVFINYINQVFLYFFGYFKLFFTYFNYYTNKRKI